MKRGIKLNNRMEIVYKANTAKKNVVYLMNKSYRIRNNYTLYMAYNRADSLASKLSIMIMRPLEETSRHRDLYERMTNDLKTRLLQFSSDVSIYNPEDAKTVFQNVGFIYMDKAYLREDLVRFDKMKAYCHKNEINLIVVESNVFVPVRVASSKEEYSAKTIRNKVMSRLVEYQEEVLNDKEMTLGELAAMSQLNEFIEKRLTHYLDRNDPSKNYLSEMSAYLKYGLISPVTIYNKVKHLDNEQVNSFIEELVVRRELAYNFVYYNRSYDQFNHITYPWAYLTMRDHLNDEREYLYTKEDYIQFKTHDEYFNTAMKEMVYFGKMHSYMRMYWCKKIIEWSKTYQEAYEIAISLNNYYFLDGNTPNGYNGVAWCFGKHDRAWTERAVFGKLRYMNSNGLKRKFDIDNYVKRIDEMIAQIKR